MIKACGQARGGTAQACALGPLSGLRIGWLGACGCLLGLSVQCRNFATKSRRLVRGFPCQSLRGYQLCCALRIRA